MLRVRLAELCALKLDDFDWTKRRARIDQAIYVDEEQQTGVHTKDTKGHKVRFVALDPVSIQVALEQLRWMNSRGESGGSWTTIPFSSLMRWTVRFRGGPSTCPDGSPRCGLGALASYGRRSTSTWP